VASSYGKKCSVPALGIGGFLKGGQGAPVEPLGTAMIGQHAGRNPEVFSLVGRGTVEVRNRLAVNGQFRVLALHVIQKARAGIPR
jgi:hypothetical protein